MICPGCFKEHAEGFCHSCLRELFGGKKISPQLPFNPPSAERPEIFLNHTRQISLSGVQVKYSLKFDQRQLQLAERDGQYILKPIPTGRFNHLDQVPANEHLTMQLAKQLFKLSVPPNALVFFKDGSPAYLIKRFDRTNDGTKLQQEDFAQIAQITSETHGQNYKYDLSYEELGGLIREYIVTHRIEIEKFFRLILFNYLFSNGDAHLKNFSAIRTVQGDYILTPVYDLLCTRVHSPNEEDMALTLFEDGFSKTYEAYGFCTYQDFLQFGQHIGIKTSRVEKMIQRFILKHDHEAVHHLIYRSFLKKEVKHAYYDYYQDRLRRLAMGT